MSLGYFITLLHIQNSRSTLKPGPRTDWKCTGSGLHVQQQQDREQLITDQQEHVMALGHFSEHTRDMQLAQDKQGTDYTETLKPCSGTPCGEATRRRQTSYIKADKLFCDGHDLIYTPL